MNVPMKKDPPEEVLTTADLARSNRAAKGGWSRARSCRGASHSRTGTYYDFRFCE